MNILNATLSPSVILLVEDSDNDAELTRIGFGQRSATVELHHVSDGEAALEFTYKRGPYTTMRSPDLILLDLHMPRMNGFEFLERVRNDAVFREVPIVVLTTSDAQSDIARCYALGCNSYVVKPIGFKAFARTIEMLAEYWLSVATAPRHLHENPSLEGQAAYQLADTGT